jgi:hypothetical protein
MLSQACATSAACLQAAALRVEAGLDELSIVITTDRTSNGPVLTYPAPSSPGGAPRQEHWALDSFRRDPWGGLAMVAPLTGSWASGEGREAKGPGVRVTYASAPGPQRRSH